MSESFDDFERRVSLVHEYAAASGDDVPDEVARYIVEALDRAYRRLLERMKDDRSLKAVIDHIMPLAEERGLPLTAASVRLLLNDYQF